MEQVLKDFNKWGDKIRFIINNVDEPEQLDEIGDNLVNAIYLAKSKNNWFTKEFVISALSAVSEMLSFDALHKWRSNYPENIYTNSSKNIGIVMAGNIPTVGFHDLLCVLVTGNVAKIKLSSEDQVLIPALLNILFSINKEWETKVINCKDRLSDYDAVIATGSNNSARYFEYYFGKVPNIIRKSRTSIGIITGDENEEDYQNLQTDIFTYFGLGCRNVNFLLVNKKVAVKELIPHIIPKNEEFLQHNKYLNNLDYNKSILLLNKVNFFDGGPFLIQESDQLFSAISVINIKYYDDEAEVESFVSENKDQLQCIVGNNKFANVDFGKTQTPSLLDYADGIDTITFLNDLNN